jgi:hypothetical protein
MKLRIIGPALVALAIAGILLAQALVDSGRQGRVGGNPYNSDLRGATGAVNVLMARADGQGFLILAKDPLLRRAPAGPSETSYRAARPMISWLAWIAVAGRPSRAGVGLYAVGLAAVALAAALLAALLHSLGRSAWWAAILPFIPGVGSSLRNGGAEILALAFVLAAVLAWPRRVAVAVACCCAAVLCRETLIVVPMALGAWAAWNRRPRGALGMWVFPIGALASWYLVLWARLGVLPTAGKATSKSLEFLTGISGIDDRGLSFAVANILIAALIALAISRAWRYRRSAIAWVVLAHAALAPLLGREIWNSFGNFARTLLPATVVGLALGLAHSGRHTPDRAAFPQPDPVISVRPAIRVG